MPRMQVGATASERARGGLPQLPVVNMFFEKSATEETGFSLQSRPGHSVIASLGDAAQEGFQKDGVLGGDRFWIVDGTLYRGETVIGSVDGDGPFSMDGYSDKLFISGGASLWGYDGTALTTVAVPDDAAISRLVVGSSRLVVLKAETEEYLFSDPLTSTIDALSLITAESQPDRLRDVLFIDDTLVLFGSDTVEFHINTTDADAPFAPLEGRVFEKGIKQSGACVAVGPTFAWVTNDNQICLGDPETVISDEGLEEKIAASSLTRLWTFYIDATEFLALRLDNATYVMPLRSRTWSRFKSYGSDNWKALCYAGGQFGLSDGSIAAFSGHLDTGTVLERWFRAGFPLNSGSVPINNVILRTNPGQTPYLTGDYAEPFVSMRTSRDGGFTWGEWKAVSLGSQGQYRRKVQWVGCGMASSVGFLAEFRVTAPVDWRVSDVLVNEQIGII